jgi:hypothetical protein
VDGLRRRSGVWEWRKTSRDDGAILAGELIPLLNPGRPKTALLNPGRGLPEGTGSGRRTAEIPLLYWVAPGVRLFSGEAGRGVSAIAGRGRAAAEGVGRTSHRRPWRSVTVPLHPIRAEQLLDVRSGEDADNSLWATVAGRICSGAE